MKISSDENDGGAPLPPEMREAHEAHQAHAILETEESMVIYGMEKHYLHRM